VPSLKVNLELYNSALLNLKLTQHRIETQLEKLLKDNGTVKRFGSDTLRIKTNSKLKVSELLRKHGVPLAYHKSTRSYHCPLGDNLLVLTNTNAYSYIQLLNGK
jgi:hypothetical protein